MRLTQVSHLFNNLGIPTFPHVFSDSQSHIARIKNRIYHGAAVAYIPTKYYHAADIPRDGEVDLSYIPTAEILADCFTMPLPKPSILKQYAAMGIIGITIGNGLGKGHGTIRNRLGNVHRNGIGNGKHIGNAVTK
jgi:hypothetical protein